MFPRVERRNYAVLGLLLFCIIQIGAFSWYGVRVYNQLATLERKNLVLESQVTSNRIMANDVAVLMSLNGHVVDSAAGKMTGRQIAETSAKIIELTRKHADVGVTIPLICGIIDSESGWDPKAVSTYTDKETGKTTIVARGLMQLVASTARPYIIADGFSGTEILFDPVWSVKWGVSHLVDLHKQYMEEGLEDVDDFHLSVTSYFWGERLAKQSLELPSSGRTSFPALGYWKRVRDAEVRWRNRGL